MAAPFARGLAAVALEAALLVGWPVGWALACFRFVESGAGADILVAGHQFAAGSMGPKVEAAARFAAKTGNRAAIGSLGDISAIVAGTAGTSVKITFEASRALLPAA